MGWASRRPGVEPQQKLDRGALKLGQAMCWKEWQLGLAFLPLGLAFFFLLLFCFVLLRELTCTFLIGFVAAQ